jgi:hypothetical protein
MPLQKGLRRESRKSFMWEEEATLMVAQKRSLTELPSVGTPLERIIRRWIESPPPIPSPPEIRKRFLTLPEARATVAKHLSLRASSPSLGTRNTVRETGTLLRRFLLVSPPCPLSSGHLAPGCTRGNTFRSSFPIILTVLLMPLCPACLLSSRNALPCRRRHVSRTAAC